MRRSTLSLAPLALSLAVGCDGSPADPIEPGPPPGCAVEGNYLLLYTQLDREQRGPWRQPDVLVIDAHGARLDTNRGLSCRTRGCDPMPSTAARWVGDACAVELVQTGADDAGVVLRATVRLDAPMGGEGTVYEGADSGAVEVTVEPLTAGALCPQVEDPPAVPGQMWPEDDHSARTLRGAVEVVEVGVSGASDIVTMRLDDGETVEALIPASMWAPAVGDTAWLALAFEQPFWTESSYLVRAAEDGPLIAGALHGRAAFLTEGPWADAGLTATAAPACGASWQYTHCTALSEHQRLTVRVGDAEHTVGVGEVVEVELPELGRAELRVVEARRDYAVDCTDYPLESYSLGLLPVQ